MKLPPYAAYGVPVAWPIDVAAARLTVLGEPGADGHPSGAEPKRTEAVAIPGVAGAVVDLLALFD